MTTVTMTIGGTTTAPTFVGNLTGNATNITATSNSSLTTAPNLVVNTSKISGILDISKGGTGANVAISAFNNLSPCVTNGDISYYSSFDNSNIPLSSLNSSNKYLRLSVSEDNSIPYWESNPGDILFGDGSDGTGVISSNTTLTSDMYYSSLTVNTGITLRTGGFRIFIQNTLTLNGTIANNGGNASGQTAGTVANSATVGAGGTSGTAGGATGGGGAFGSAGVANSLGGSGGKGGGTTGAAGVATVPINANGGTKVFRGFPSVFTGRDVTGLMVAGGAGGSGGQGGSTGVGGGGGGGGGVVVIACRRVTGSGTITANGGDGGNGSAANGNGGGGGGGGVIVFTSLGGTILTSVAGGSGGAGNGTGVAGASGGSGNVYTFTP